MTNQLWREDDDELFAKNFDQYLEMRKALLIAPLPFWY
jgi:hypothetical protein